MAQILVSILFLGSVLHLTTSQLQPIRINVNLADAQTEEHRIHLSPTIDLPPLFINFTNSLVKSLSDVVLDPGSVLETQQKTAIFPPLPPTPIPITEFMNIPSNPDPILESRRQFIINMTRNAWEAYTRYAWSQPELHPVSRPNATEGGNGKSIFAAMSTLWVMGLTESFTAATDWIDQQMNTSQIVQDELWEVPGALLSLYALTGNGFFLQKARHVADRLMVEDNNHWGYSRMWANQVLEYRYLSDLTGCSKYTESVEKIEKILDDIEDFKEERLQQSTGNSLMLLVKSYFQTAGTYTKPLKAKLYPVLDRLESTGFLTSAPELGLAFIRLSSTRPFMFDWHCIFGGLLSLAGEILPEVQRHKTGWSTADEIHHLKLLHKAEHYFHLGRNLTAACHQSANSTATGLPFGQFKISPASGKVLGAGGYWLRHQLAETYFILYRMTLDKKYQDWAWELAQAIHKNARIATSGGYAGVQKVDRLPVEKFFDSQQAEFLSGTLKYLYLIFAPEEFMPLNQWVFNAQGHPLPICGRNWAYPGGACRRHDDGVGLV